MWRYSMAMINDTKGNPSWYGDLVGDWREEIVLPDATRLQDIRIFSTWYPTTHKFPWLMTDHCYWLSCVNQNIGYNQPTNTGYYLGSDIKRDADAWAEAEKVQSQWITTGIEAIHNSEFMIQNSQFSIYNGELFDLLGRRVTTPKTGLYIRNGKKIIIK